MAILEGLVQGDMARQRREQLNFLRQSQERELTMKGYSFDEKGNMSVRSGSMGEAEQLAAKEATQLAKATQGKLAALATDTAFEDFAHTGDANYLQNALDNDPVLKQAWGERGVQLVSNLDFTNDSKLLANAGLVPSFYDTPAKQELVRKNLYKVYDGKDWSVGLLNNAVMETGALKRMGMRRGQVIVDNLESMRNMMNGPEGNAWAAKGHKYEKEINAAAEEFDLPPNLIAAMMKQESAGDPNAVSEKGATGLMQLMEGTATEMGVTDRLDPSQNIRGGAKYIKMMLDKYGDLPTALAAYNAGPGNVDKHKGIPPFAETQNYVNKIMANLDESEAYNGGSSKTVVEGFRNRNQEIIDTILNDRRAVANAAQGTTNTLRDSKDINEITSTIRGQDQKDIELGIAKENLDVERQKIAAKLATEGSTTEQKNLSAAADKTKAMLESFGGEDKFMQMDFTKNSKAKRDALVIINEVEQLNGQEPTDEQKKKITELNKLITLANPAVKLNPNTVGPIDDKLSTINKYVSENMEDVQAKAAMSYMRNIIRSSLIGGSQTPQEITNDVAALGSMGQQAGPILAMFQNVLSGLQADLDSTTSFMNPYSVKVRLGASQEQLDAAKAGLQTALDKISGVSETATGQTAKPRDQQQVILDNAFGD